MLWISIILFGLALYLLLSNKQSKISGYFPESEVDEEIVSAINLNSLMEQKRWQRFKNNLSPTIQVLGPRANFIIVAFIFIVAYLTYYVTYELLKINSLLVAGGIFFLVIVWAYHWLQNKRRITFEKTFPDALNILMSAVTAGESLMHAFSFVGDNMDGEVGREFKEMGDRLKLGESAEQVLLRSCKAFPYPEYIFFTITIRANINRGGQLKNVLARLIRILVDARTLETKKMAMTSEARISAKVVAAIPVAFALMVNQVSPDHINFILNDPNGRWILYYVVGSEVLGLFIVWLLVKGVRQ
ncbi:type II secretion system F family protein [Vibrio owensii]|uniref:type II secretion system F family protein n=1 Tax=Vibrio harveyi group TaxID=717610 RepID=UPI0005EFD831|nr:type II secretion system F family protein [Vibrio owensii]AQW59626.1 type II secretion system protein F [Vibrio owensii]MDA0380733.1 type II secretion system F family protein [Vibrio owensii]TDE23759.1 type II secretion system protein F [Vibrio owensii]